MHLQIRGTKIVPTQYGNTIQITHLWMYDDNWKYIKFIAMDEWIAEFLKTFPILINWDIMDKFIEWKEEVNTLFKIE